LVNYCLTQYDIKMIS